MTNAEKHTRGPWRIESTGTMSGRWFSILAGGEPYYQGGGFYEVAQTGTYEVERQSVEGQPQTDAHLGWVRTHDADEVEANAYLIAAAPSLLEALTFCRSVINSGGAWEMSERMALEKAEAAIAQATGA